MHFCFLLHFVAFCVMIARALAQKYNGAGPFLKHPSEINALRPKMRDGIVTRSSETTQRHAKRAKRRCKEIIKDDKRERAIRHGRHEWAFCAMHDMHDFCKELRALIFFSLCCLSSHSGQLTPCEIKAWSRPQEEAITFWVVKAPRWRHERKNMNHEIDT